MCGHLDENKKRELFCHVCYCIRRERPINRCVRHCGHFYSDEQKPVTKPWCSAMENFFSSRAPQTICRCIDINIFASIGKINFD